LGSSVTKADHPRSAEGTTRTQQPSRPNAGAKAPGAATQASSMGTSGSRRTKIRKCPEGTLNLQVRNLSDSMKSRMPASARGTERSPSAARPARARPLPLQISGACTVKDDCAGGGITLTALTSRRSGRSVGLISEDCLSHSPTAGVRRRRGLAMRTLCKTAGIYGVPARHTTMLWKGPDKVEDNRCPQGPSDEVRDLEEDVGEPPPQNNDDSEQQVVTKPPCDLEKAADPPFGNGDAWSAFGATVRHLDGLPWGARFQEGGSTTSGACPRFHLSLAPRQTSLLEVDSLTTDLGKVTNPARPPEALDCARSDWCMNDGSGPSCFLSSFEDPRRIKSLSPPRRQRIQEPSLYVNEPTAPLRARGAYADVREEQRRVLPREPIAHEVLPRPFTPPVVPLGKLLKSFESQHKAVPGVPQQYDFTKDETWREAIQRVGLDPNDEVEVRGSNQDSGCGRHRPRREDRVCR